MMAKLIASKQGSMEKPDMDAKMKMLEALKEEMAKMMSAKPSESSDIMDSPEKEMPSDIEEVEAPEMDEHEPSSEIEELAGDELSDEDIAKLEEILAKAKASKMKV